MKTKKRNPNDATLRNIRALKKRVNSVYGWFEFATSSMRERITKLEFEVADLKRERKMVQPRGKGK